MRLELAKLFDPDTGELARRIPVGSRPVFEDIEVSSGRLQYRPLGAARFVTEGKSERLLENFLELAEASDSEIGNYARKSGVLGLCVHGLPVGHESLRTRLAWLVIAEKELRRPVRTLFDQLLIQRLRYSPSQVDAPCLLQMTSKTVLSEPLELWRAYASLAVELLKRAADGRGQKREELAETLDHWLLLTPLRLSCVVDKRGQLGLKLRADNPLSALFGILGAQVFFAASGSQSLLVCSACGRPYMPKRLPRTGKHTYCRRCGIRAAWRNASRLYYKNHAMKDDEDSTKTKCR